MEKKLFGVMPPIITPFKNNEELDLPALKANFARWNQTGLSGYLVLGSNGEAVYLSEKEKDAVLAASREAIPADKILMAGTGQESTRATIEATRRAAQLGADCALAVTPCYFKAQMTPPRLAAHFKRVADGSPIPILAYNFPQATGVNMGPELVAELAEHPNLIGIKDSSGIVNQFSSILQSTADGFKAFVGNAEVFYPALCLGAAGGILAVANVVPEICVEIYETHRAGNHEKARRLQWKMARLAALVTRIHGVGGLKAAMRMAGYQSGGVRSPLAMPGAEATKELEAEYRKVKAG